MWVTLSKCIVLLASLLLSVLVLLFLSLLMLVLLNSLFVFLRNKNIPGKRNMLGKALSEKKIVIETIEKGLIPPIPTILFHKSRVNKH